MEKLQRIHNLKKEKGGLVLNRFSKYQGRAGGCGGTVWGGRRRRQGRGSNVVVDVVVVVLWKWKIAESPQLEEIRGGACAESVQRVSGECWRMWWDGLGRAET